MASQPYQQQVDPGGTAPLPMARGGFGDAAAAGFGQVVAATEDLGKALQAHEQDQQATDFAAKFADARLTFDKARVDARANAGPGAAGYYAQMEKAYGDTFTPLLDTISDPKLRAKAAAQIDGYKASTLDGDYEFETTSRAAKAITDVQTAADTQSAIVRTSTDPNAYAQETGAFDFTARSMTGITEDARSKLLRAGHAQLAGASNERGIDVNPKAQIALLDSGAYNDVLDGKEIDRYRAQAVLAQTVRDNEEKHQAALRKAALSDQIATVKSQQSSGIEVPDKVLADLAGQAAAVGDNSSAFDLNDARVRNGVNKEAKGWTPQQWETERNRLRALKTPTPQEQVRLDQIEKRMPSAVSEFDKDPGAWAAANKVPPPVLDWSNQATVTAREQWRNTVSRATGRNTPFLSPAEVSDLKDEAGSGAGGELSVVNKIATIGGPQAVSEMLRILPDDPKASRLVLLNPATRNLAMRGLDLLDKTPSYLPDKVARQPFLDRLGIAGSLMDGNQVEGVYAVAKGLYAEKMRRAGKLDPSGGSIDQGEWEQAIHAALGGKYDGQHWFGGVWSWNGQQVLIPNTITGKQFEGAMTKLSTMSWKAGDQNAPIYANGQAMPLSALKGFTPVERPDGYYEFHGQNGTVVKRKGGIFTLDLGRFAQGFPK